MGFPLPLGLIVAPTGSASRHEEAFALCDTQSLIHGTKAKGSGNVKRSLFVIRRLFLISLVHVVWLTPVVAVVDEFQLTASDAAAGDHVGASVGIDANTIIVGAAVADLGGAAYVYVRIGFAWAEQAKLTPDDAAFGDNFGFSVAIHKDTAVVGAKQKHAAYVFVRSGNTWSQQAKLTVAESDDAFGSAVAIHDDTIVVGAPHQVVGALEDGAAYVFVRDETGTWNQQAKLLPTPSASSTFFGISVAIHGNTAFVGAPRDDEVASSAGAAYIFERSGAVWGAPIKLLPNSLTIIDAFGFSVAVSGDTGVGGATLGEGIVPEAGRVYVFVRDAATWGEQDLVTADDGEFFDHFGSSVAVDGDSLLVGAFRTEGPLADVTLPVPTFGYLFKRDEGNWVQGEKLTAGMGQISFQDSAFAGLSGCTAVIGSTVDDVGVLTQAGAVYGFFVEDCPCSDPVPNLLSWWTLDEKDPPAFAFDSQGTNNGDWVHNPTPVDGIVDGALSFDGNLQSVQVPHDGSLNFGSHGDFTIDAWINPTEVVLLGSIVSKLDPGTGVGFSLRLVEGKLAFIISDGSTTNPAFVSTNEIPLDTWTFVAVTIDRAADIGRVLVNDTLEGTFTPSATASGSIDNTQPLFIANASPDDRYKGAIDEVEIYSRSLEESEVLLIYDSFIGGKCKPCITPPEGIVAWWPFDESEGPLSQDIVGNNVGDQVGSPTSAPGKVDFSLQFTSIGQHVKVADNPTLNFDESTSFSIDVWIRPEEVKDLASLLVDKTDPETLVGYRLLLRDGHVVFSMSDGSFPQTTYVSQQKVSPGGWSFVAVTVDRDTNEGKVYLNSTLDGTFIPSPDSTANDSPLFIGGNPFNQALTLPGRIDELEVYSRVLSQTDVDRLYIAEAEGKCKPVPPDEMERSGRFFWLILIAVLLVFLIVLAWVFGQK